MIALMRRDLIACSMFLLIGLAIYVLYAVTYHQEALGYFFVNVVTTFILILLPIVVEDKYRIDTLVCYLPTSRAKVVLARYAAALSALIAGLVLYYGVGSALGVGSASPGFRTLCSREAVLVFAALPTSFAAVFLPCYFRFGLGRGAFVFMILALLFSMIVTATSLAAGLFGGSDGFTMTPRMAEHPEQALVALVDHVAASVGRGPFYFMAVSSAVAVATVSILLSIRAFHQRDF